MRVTAALGIVPMAVACVWINPQVAVAVPQPKPAVLTATGCCVGSNADTDVRKTQIMNSPSFVPSDSPFV